MPGLDGLAAGRYQDDAPFAADGDVDVSSPAGSKRDAWLACLRGPQGDGALLISRGNAVVVLAQRDGHNANSFPLETQGLQTRPTV